MSRNHDHDHDHDHSHAHSHDDHDHDHNDETQPALQSLIWKQIDFDNIRTLNESQTNAGRAVIKKTWQQRLESEPEVISDADEQLLIHIPFAGVLKLHSILIRSSTDASSPRTMRIFLNRDDIDFSNASEVSPTQSLHISQTNDVQELPVRRALFGNTYNLSLFIEDNYGDDVSRVYWLGIKGEFRELNREPVEALYERAANPKDHELIAGVGSKGSMGSGNRHGM